MSIFSRSGDLRSPSDSPSMHHREPSYDPGLDNERLDELRARIDSGFYSQPDVLRKVAARLVDDWQSQDET